MKHYISTCYYMNRLPFLAITFGLVIASYSQSPSIINYQGRLSVGGTNVFQGNSGQFKFALVNGARQATAVGSVSGGFLTVVTITDRGAGYVSAPNIVVNDSTGSGAILTASISGGVLTGITVDNPGHGYSISPTIAIDPPSTNTSATFWSNDGSSSGGNAPVHFVTLPVSQGLFSVNLGDLSVSNMTSALTPSIFTNADVRLRIWFNDGVSGFQQFYPDQRLTSVGYALLAGNVADGSITSSKIANGAVGVNSLSSNAISTFNVADGAITSSKIMDASITASKLAPGSVSTFPNGIAVFNSSGIWTNPGVSRVIVKLWGGGGGDFSGTGSAYGGGGAYCEGVVTLTDNIVPVTVGLGGTNGSSYAGWPSSAGGNSSFLSLVAGGGGGASADRGGDGGTPSGGTIMSSGGSGGTGASGGSGGVPGAPIGLKASGTVGGAGGKGVVIIYY